MASPRYIVKSDNFMAGIGAGAYTSWKHIDAGNTGRTIITRSTKVNAGLILCNIVVNTTGATSSTVVSDSINGVIAVIKASVQEKDFHYNIPLKGNLVIDNPGGQDLTVVYVTP